jgi:tocopherol O-methyltransferase
MDTLSQQEQDVLRYYTDQTDDFYIKKWDPDEFHFGIYPEEESIGTYKTRNWEIHRQGIRRMTEAVTDPAQIRSSDVVVDAGCGVGGTAIYLARRHGCRVIGVNLCPRQIEIAERKVQEAGLAGMIRFLGGDCSRHLPLDTDSVDVVVNIESACHYSNRDNFIRECARIIKTGGRLVAEDWIARDSIDQSKFIARMCDAWFLQFPLETPSSYFAGLTRNGFHVVELVDLGGLSPTIEFLKIASHRLIKKAAENNRLLTDNEKMWLHQFETIACAYHEGHFTLLRYHARLGPPRDDVGRERLSWVSS